MSKASQEGPLPAPNLLDKSWEAVQRKTFTNWVNNQLMKKKTLEPVANLDTDFASGEKLIQLLEVIGDESLGRYNRNPRMRIQKAENVNKALEFIRKRGVQLTNIGAEDIIDENGKLILGLVWSLILRFSIAEIKEDGLSAKEGLLLWCQRRTAPYSEDFFIKDFSTSWMDGLALCGLIHRHRPDLIDYWSLDKTARHENTRLAMDIAASQLGIPKLLDVEDLVDVAKPEERSVITYISQFYHAFSTMQKVGTAGRRIGQLGSILEQAWELQHQYEKRAAELLEVIRGVIGDWEEAQPGDYLGAVELLKNFETHKNTTKREWTVEKRELESLLGNIITKLRTYNLATYQPPAGLTLEDLNNSWNKLLHIEASRKRTLSQFIRETRDKLRREFADSANSFSENLLSVSTALSKVDGALQSQLNEVNNLLKSLEPIRESLEDIGAQNDLCIAAHATDNEFTIYSFEDLSFDYRLVEENLKKKIAFIENQLVAQGMTNVTPQQLEEWTETFKIFDKDNMNSLTKDQFSSALQALGIICEEEEFERHFKALSSKDCVSFSKFMEHVKSSVEDRITMEGSLDAFQSLSLGKDVITVDDMVRGGVPVSIINHFKKEMETINGGMDYKTYLNRSFDCLRC